ncbi:NAD-dependent epimerase/dehydratase family protein [Pedobacter sp. NJ-S-72]
MMLLTGASGFLGKIIRLKYQKRIITLGRSAAEDVVCDLSQQIPAIPKVDIVVHAAGKAHSSVPKTEAEIQEFYNVNVKGTINLLTALSNAEQLPASFVFISSVAVYGLESGENINEDAPLNAVDPYGKSKITAEELVQDWCTKNNVVCAILRLPLIAGTNPPGNLGAMINGIKKGYYLNIAGGKAKKSIVLATDVTEILLKTAEIGGIYNLTDGYDPSFAELADNIAVCWVKVNHLISRDL